MGAEQVLKGGLADVRLHAGHTQVELAEALGTTQSAVSRMERQDDIHVSTLRQYVEATGGRLRLVAVYRDGEIEFSVGREGGGSE